MTESKHIFIEEFQWSKKWLLHEIVVEAVFTMTNMLLTHNTEHAVILHLVGYLHIEV